MKRLRTLSLAIGIAASGVALAQQGDLTTDIHNNMPMDMQKDSQQSMNGRNSAPKTVVHHADATVKSVNREKEIVTLVHGPVKSLNWPGMTMGFGVKDKAMLEQFVAGSKVNVEFVKEGAKYVITAAK